MDKVIKKISIQFAVIIFFIMALASLISHRPLTTCCARCITGAIVAYVICTFSMKAIFTVIIHAIAKSKSQQ